MAKEQAQSPSWSLQERTDLEKKKEKKNFPAGRAPGGGAGAGGPKESRLFLGRLPPGCRAGPHEWRPNKLFF